MTRLDQVDRSVPTTATVRAEDIADAVRRSGVRVVVLDDDPTGTQSVSGLPVLTRWTEDDFGWAFDQLAPAVYVLTNSRSLEPATAGAVVHEVIEAALAVARRRDVPLTFVSRSDSTLRGHFPLETDAIATAVARDGGRPVDGVLLVPAFPDAGRVTAGGVHYLAGPDGELVPVGETEFARDASFGYTQSELAAWAEEKSAGRIKRSEVIPLPLQTVRRGPQAVAETLLTASGGRPIAVDAVREEDLRLVARGLLRAEELGGTYVCRVGPPFVRAMIGQAPRDPLTAADITAPPTGGLVVVGSHVALSTRQLARLRERRPDAFYLELDVAEVGDPERSAARVRAAADAVVAELPSRDVVVATSRTVRPGLDFARRVSLALIALTRDVTLRQRPRFVVAKGGITSHDLAADGLGIARAVVRGPLLPGITSLWEPRIGPAIGLPYVVFPGNVGDDDALADVVSILTAGGSS
jgi:uncharacterized protein YgbK (DUF1537 family)